MAKLIKLCFPNRRFLRRMHIIHQSICSLLSSVNWHCCSLKNTHNFLMRLSFFCRVRTGVSIITILQYRIIFQPAASERGQYQVHIHHSLSFPLPSPLLYRKVSAMQASLHNKRNRPAVPKNKSAPELSLKN